MAMQVVLAMLPLAIVMIAGPQIITAIFLATSLSPVRNSLMYLLGVALAVPLGIGVVYVVASAVSSRAPKIPNSSDLGVLDVLVIALLVYLAVSVFLRRKKETEPPKWMAKLQEATPKFAFTAGFLLYLFFPTDLITMITVGTYAAKNGLPYVATLGFVALTLALASMPLLMYLALGKRAEVTLPKLRDWMNTNSWVVNEVVVLFFLVMQIVGALQSLGVIG